MIIEEWDDSVHTLYDKKYNIQCSVSCSKRKFALLQLGKNIPFDCFPIILSYIEGDDQDFCSNWESHYLFDYLRRFNLFDF